MLARGDAGRARVCACLDELRASLGLRKIRVGALIRSELAEHGHEPRVAKSITRWRRSPAGWIALMLAAPALGASEERE